MKQLTAFFIKEGKILDEKSYAALKSQPILGITINYIFGGYRGAIASLKASPQFGPLIKHLDTPEVKPTVKPVATKAPVWPTPANKPVAAKPAKVKVEKKDG